MVNHSARRETDERTAAVQRLLDEARQDEPVTDELDSSVDEDDDSLGALLSALPASVYGATVTAAVDDLLAGGEGMTVKARQLLIEGAERGARWRRNMGGTLTRALLAQRECAKKPLTEVCEATGLDARTARAVELGSLPLQDVDATMIAQWIKTVGLDPDTALKALHRTLSPATARGVYASADVSAGMTTDAQRYYEAVEKALVE